ncbi:MMT1 Co Zn Cd cation transporter [Pyrenophora tritici-repentis]|uniref:Cation efflux protein n=2 Tax=Pyrenophora tritici-repentis TaxID=45151 RepID=A0A2W1H4U5_9PLEO|nr:cation diffusion facilitator 10 [Pyrenophora tritici-repentis Pt-1C-BFP]KAA8625736.1 cation diffusion facilitator 10 [Pyrenophora tritici-repentis]EDU40540.1 cation diffusion facilitator 10 [Pyrenophora tritici-repentis Pt-1C-BFP]KAF7454155.1 cation diffusion facilitator 10 [Pyrenophora tritici-repentis]KAF7577245.1 MMT1, Co-Zn-Cd cation transporter [Pyrenophora tritici-repentis]KAG9387903.1 cation diffusion facilitator 10 [Pyrenophora tritici-repentis]
MTDYGATPPTPSSPAHVPRSSSHPRLTNSKLFLPLQNDASAISTRGHHLPSLLHHTRRPSTIRSNERRGSETDDEDLEAYRNGLMMPHDRDSDRRSSIGAHVLNTPQMRSQRLIGNSNPRYQWEKYYKSEEELKGMKKPVREYYERNNELLQNYLYIDRLLDSSLPHNLIQEYTNLESGSVKIPTTITEESSANSTPIPSIPGAKNGSNTPSLPSENGRSASSNSLNASNGNGATKPMVKRTPKNLYKVPEADENTPLLAREHAVDDDEEEALQNSKLKDWVPEEDEDTDSPIVKLALYVNLSANTALLIMKIVVTVLTSSLSVVASLVDAALDFLSTAIVWFTSWMIARQDRYAYPVGRRRLEPIGVLIFSVIMMTSFFQVGIEGVSRLSGPDHTIVQLTIPAVAIMTLTVVIKGMCWLWCRLIRNSSVQALAQDAMTDVVFNTFSILFPLVGYFAKIWWLDALGGILLSAYVIINWSATSAEHIRNLTGASATADERNILLYMTMRFAKSIKRIQGLQAYHAGDKLNVEVDIVVDESLSLRDSHDLGESLQYVLESVPYVDRAFVHIDYTDYNFPTHMSQQE